MKYSKLQPDGESPTQQFLKSLTLRKIIVLVGCLAVLKLSWNLLFGASINSKNVIDIGHGVEYQPAGFDFQPKSCVMEPGSGVCKPYGESSAAITAKGLVAMGNSFYLDGREFRILSGSMHYFRVLPALWGDRLLKMKAAGLNTVTTYIPWNLHEKIPGFYSMGGEWDLTSFIKQVQKVGLKLIVRPGPFICAEWEFGGLPSWLLRHHNMKVRSSDGPFSAAVERYFSKLLPLLAPFTHKRGGPIIAFQIENEFGSYKRHDPEYLLFLKDQYIKYNLDELMFTSDGTDYLINGTLPGVLATINFDRRPEVHFDRLRKFQPNKPIMIGEFWSGWFDHWGERHHRQDLSKLEVQLDYIFSQNASINFYMFVGGTNFGFWNGANYGKNILPTITSYDYDAPVGENGDVSEKLMLIQGLIRKYGLGPVDWPEVPPNAKSIDYGFVDMTHSLPYHAMLSFLTEESEVRENPVSMEQLNTNNDGGQGYGWLLYRTKIKGGRKITVEGIVRDRAQIIVNETEEVGRWSWFAPQTDVSLPRLRGGMEQQTTLDIFVENVGRVNFYAHKTNPRDLLDMQRKGILGRILIDGQEQVHWIHVPFQFNHKMKQMLKDVSQWQPYAKHSVPAAYRGILTINSNPQDTYIDLENWDKGIVMVNGFNLGRYWMRKGPQKRLYVPGPLLVQGQNEVIVFELHTPHNKVEFSNTPYLG